MCGTEGCGAYRYWPSVSACSGRHCAHDAQCFALASLWASKAGGYYNPNPFA